METRKKLQYYLEVAGIGLVRAMVWLLPLKLARSLGGLLGWKAWKIFRIRRRVALDNIRQALPFAASGEAADRIGCSSYMNMGRSMMEFVKLGRLDARDICEMVEIGTLAPFDEALAAGRGAVLVTGHLGNWELGAAAMAANGYRIHVVVARQSNPLVDDWINGIRRGKVASVIDRGSAGDIKRAFRALADNEFVAFVADQDARRHGAFVEFLGRPASTHKGPAQFAVRRNCPVVAGFTHRTGDSGRHRLEIVGPMWPDGSLDEDAAVAALMQRYTDALADAVRRYPADYLWAHRRWKSQPS